MKVLVLGGGGREHALVWKLAKSPHVTSLICAPGNPGIATHAECVPVNVMQFDLVLELIRQRTPDLVVIGPDDPLGAGLADLVEATGTPVFGPSGSAARIESSKAFAKQLMHEDGIPTATSRTATTMDAATQAIRELAVAGRVVIKADGLALGKGVVIAESETEAIATAQEFLSGDRFGESGKTIVIEEFLTGQEISFFVLSDGQTFHPLAAACDYKQVGDGDIGPNTGGMGCYTPPPVFTPELRETVLRTIIEPVFAGLAKRNAPFRGVLYAGLIVTKQGVKVIEFNARFGDPETQVLMPVLQDDLFPLVWGCATHSLGEVAAPKCARTAVGVALASPGYPGSYPKGAQIHGLPEDLVNIDQNATLFHAGTALDQRGQVITNGGRVLTMVGTGPDLRAARATAYQRVQQVSFAGMHYRNDIALREVS